MSISTTLPTFLIDALAALYYAHNSSYFTFSISTIICLVIYPGFIPAATDAILEELIQQLCSRLEKEILHKKRRFSLFGALQFDADIRALLSFFISIAPNIAVRQKFQRLSQICTLLSLEQLKELKDFLNVKWLINNKEIREVLILRFPAEAVDSELNYIMK